MTEAAEERRAAQTDAAWQNAPVALLRLDPDGRVLDANELILVWLGRRREDVVGRARIGDLLTVGGRIFWETHVGPQLRLEGHVDEVAVELRGADGRKAVLMSARQGVRAGEVGAGEVHQEEEAVVDVALFAAGQRVRYEREILAARDVAERAAERLRTLQAVSIALAPAADVDALADALAQTLVQRLGVSAVLLWLPDGRGGWRRLGSAPAVASAALAPPASGLTVEHDGTVVLELSPRPDLRGALVISPSMSPGDEPLDHDTLVAVSRQTSVALGRAALAEHSASVAHELQHAMLRGDLPDDPRFALETVYRPGVRNLEVGGDWYDAFWLGDDSLALVVGDVVGRGLDAATTMGQLRTAVRAVAVPELGPAEVLDRLDAFVERAGTGFGASVAYAVVDLVAGRLRYACAGHPPPLVVGPSTPGRLLWEGRSATLGVTSTRRSATEQLAGGDTLLLYTDGLVERRDRHLRAGLDSLVGEASSWRAAGRTFDGTFADELLAGGGEGDDTCLLALTIAARP